MVGRPGVVIRSCQLVGGPDDGLVLEVDSRHLREDVAGTGRLYVLVSGQVYRLGELGKIEADDPIPLAFVPEPPPL